MKLQATLFSLGDIGEQLYQWWVQLKYLLQEHLPPVQNNTYNQI